MNSQQPKKVALEGYPKDTPVKICTKCKVEKSLDDFYWWKTYNKYKPQCKPCTKEYTTKYRKANPQKWRDNFKKHSKKWFEVVNEWKSQGCKKCGEKRPHLIDAHHIDPKTKSFAVGHSQRGVEITKKELEKCIQLCSNCHRHFHFLEREGGIGIGEFVYLEYKINKL